ncbi:hypothetical protein OAF83_00735 [Rubripirellula sp.]|nr:hypothetical protein [Rubripirellula sp.]MDB4749407.1 hypothetical protein [Rubripirellula sp.]
MPRPKTILPPTIIDYCARCTNEERSAIVAYCCHLTFSDKSIKRLEVDFVEAIANQMEVSVHELRKMAQKARQRRLRIKTPKSRAARILLFHLAIRTASADSETDTRERSALDHLAKKLRIAPEIVNRELNKLHRKCVLKSDTSPSPLLKPESKQGKTADLKRGVIESLPQYMVAENLRAQLTSPKIPSGSQAAGELIYTITGNGDVELELDGPGFDLPPGETFEVLIEGKHLCEITSPLNYRAQPIQVKQQTCETQFTTGDSVVIQHQNAVLLFGTLAANVCS